MKRNCRVGIIFLSLMIVLSGCGIANDDTNKKDQEYKLVRGAVSLNGEVVESLPAFVGSSDVRLPFMQIVQLLGMTVESKEDGLVYITNCDDPYVLTLSPEIVLVKQGDDSNLMLPPPGSSSYYCQYEMDDVFVDDATLSSALFFMGVTIHYAIDYEIPKIEIVRVSDPTA